MPENILGTLPTESYFMLTKLLHSLVIQISHRQQGGAVITTVASQEEGSWFKFQFVFKLVCMFSLCLGRFSPDTPASSHFLSIPKT